MDEYYQDASFAEKYFIYILMAIGLVWAPIYLYCFYQCFCGKGVVSVVPCCKPCIYKLANRGIVGADIDTKGNVKYRSITDAEIQDVSNAARILGS